MTKNIKLLLSGGAVALLGVLAIQGCSSSSDDSSTPAGGAGATAGAGAAGKAGASTGGSSTAGTSSGGFGGSGTAGATTGGATAGGTGGSGGATTGEAGESAGGAGADLVDCTTFCSDEEATCTFGAATAAPYANSAACMTACMGFTPGDVGVYPAGPTTGNTFACRRWHLSKAGSTPGTPATAATHCPHTGLLSKNAYTDTTATGPCAG